MYNVMFYHTGDTGPKLLESFNTVREARVELKCRVAEGRNPRMVKVKGLDRYEYISQEYDRWGFAFYIKYDHDHLNALLKTPKS
jgi:hypothetical protein